VILVERCCVSGILGVVLDEACCEGDHKEYEHGRYPKGVLPWEESDQEGRHEIRQDASALDHEPEQSYELTSIFLTEPATVNLDDGDGSEGLEVRVASPEDCSHREQRMSTEKTLRQPETAEGYICSCDPEGARDQCALTS
jgi:hypothetical protein